MKCTKDLYTHIFISNKYGLKVKVRKQFEEEVIAIGYRLADLLAHHNLPEKKREYIQLLQELNALGETIFEEHTENLKNNYSSPSNQLIVEVQSYGYIWGKISILKSIINFIVKKIEVTETTLTKEEEQEIIDKSKQEDDLGYMG